MSNKNELPADVQEQHPNKVYLLPKEQQKEIKAFAEEMTKNLETSSAHGVGFWSGAFSGITMGAAHYAIKINELQLKHSALQYEYQELKDQLARLEQGQHQQAGAMWVKGIPTVKMLHFAKVKSMIEDDVIYDAIIWPIEGSDYWWCVGKGFKFDAPPGVIIAHLDLTGGKAYELEKLRQWKMEAVELQIPIIAYVHKHLEHNIGDSCTALVIAELDRLREENVALKAQPGDTFLLNRMGVTLENIYRIHSVQWNEHDRSVIRGILDQWEQTKNNSGPIVEVFVPCMEHDPRCCGGYTSNDGQSLCYVREAKVPVLETGAVWVKASDRLPERQESVIVRGYLNEQGYSDHLFIAYGHRAGSPDNPQMYFEYGNRSFLTNDIEWLDESGAAANDLQQELALSKEVNKEALALTEKAQQRLQDVKDNGDKLALAARRLALSMTVHPDYEPNSEFADRVQGVWEAEAEWSGEKPKDGLEWLHGDHIEFCYRHPDGRVEVRYRRIEGTPECNAMIAEVDALIEKAKPVVSPYFYRKEGEKEVKP